jgi:hypothetical protein
VALCQSDAADDGGAVVSAQSGLKHAGELRIAERNVGAENEEPTG